MGAGDVVGIVVVVGGTLLLAAAGVVGLLIIAGQYRTVQALRAENKKLQEQVEAARKILTEARVPVTLHITDEQIAQLASMVNNVREQTNLPKEQVH